MSSRSNSIYDAVVIGAGHNGLTAAAYLARAGYSTLVLERRDIVGGCCVTEQIAPVCRASTTSYIASMLRPAVIRDLHLADHGLRMLPCDPALQVPFPDGRLVSWWSNRDRVVKELRMISPKDAETFVHVDDRLKKLARYLQPFFLEPPPEPGTQSFDGWSDLFRAGKRFRGISATEISQLVSFLTGSLGEFFARHYKSQKNKTAVPRQQHLRQTRRPLPTGLRPRPALSSPQRRRARTTRLLRTRPRRHGLDHQRYG